MRQDGVLDLLRAALATDPRLGFVLGGLVANAVMTAVEIALFLVR